MAIVTQVATAMHPQGRARPGAEADEAGLRGAPVLKVRLGHHERPPGRRVAFADVSARLCIVKPLGQRYQEA
jgi:hypothetical protein